jgi:hypothetical protein
MSSKTASTPAPIYAALVAESGSDPLAERDLVAAAEALLAEVA